jgi:hypothetical protein
VKEKKQKEQKKERKNQTNGQGREVYRKKKWIKRR